MAKDRILLVYTGGTIGGTRSDSNVISSDIAPKLFISAIYESSPELRENVEIDHCTPVKKFSESMAPADWMTVAKEINKQLKEVDYLAVIVAHGTDTMCYTSAALSYITFERSVPIIFTGSNTPITEHDSDGPKNFINAIFVARQKLPANVYVSFSGTPLEDSYVHLGNRVRKVRFDNDCFSSINVPYYGSVKKTFLGKREFSHNNQFNDDLLFKNLSSKFEPRVKEKVDCYSVYPGFDPYIIEHRISKNLVAGIILELYNSGTADTSSQKYSLLSTLELARKNKIPVFAISQHIGSVAMNTYKSSIDLKNVGVLSLKDMIREAAMTKLMLTLSKTSNYDDVKKIMLSNVAGEITD